MGALDLEMAGRPEEVGAADNPVMARLLGESALAWRLAVRVLGSTDGAEDVVQQAYLAAIEQLRSGLPPIEERAWFLGVVANLARRHVRTEANLKRRQTAMERVRPEAPASDPELVSRLRHGTRS